jgi:hypothetical protein
MAPRRFTISGLMKAAPAKHIMHTKPESTRSELRNTLQKEQIPRVGARLLSNPHWCICTNHGTSFKRCEKSGLGRVRYQVNMRCFHKGKHRAIHAQVQFSAGLLREQRCQAKAAVQVYPRHRAFQCY